MTKVRYSFQSSYILRRPQNFAKSPPYYCPMKCQSKSGWRFSKILWPSQNVWTLFFLMKTHCHVYCNVYRVSKVQWNIWRIKSEDVIHKKCRIFPNPKSISNETKDIQEIQFILFWMVWIEMKEMNTNNNEFWRSGYSC